MFWIECLIESGIVKQELLSSCSERQMSASRFSRPPEGRHATNRC
jgi:hypothetical protein